MRRAGTYFLMCAGLIVIGVVIWKARPESEAALLQRLPTQDATVLSVDFAALRKGGVLGMLAGNRATEEPEYLAFVKSSGFDYRKDLDSAMVAFGPNATYFLVRGRFDWKKLETYARENGGSCYDRLCRLPGSKPERRISFLPLRADLMGLAVSTDDLAASKLSENGPQRQIEIPKEPVWLSVPASALKPSLDTPMATRLFASAMSGADRVTLALGAKDGGYAARLEADCGSLKDAQAITAQLVKFTGSLKGPAKDDLSGLLMAGTFQQAGKKVLGFWPIRKSLIENLVGGA